MQKITPNLWYDKEAKEAAEFYVSAFGKNSRIKNVSTIHGTPSGSVDIVSFEIWGFDFLAISAGPIFKFNPSISFHVLCETKEEVDAIWEKLSKGGRILMPLDRYPFSERFGWVQDKYGLTWQVFHSTEKKEEIAPALMFTGKVAGKAEEAINFWTSVFPDSKIHDISRYGKNAGVEKEGSAQYAPFAISGQEFSAMDSARDHGFSFNEAISFIVHCETQEEIDYYWGKLSAVPEAEQCGWLKDKFGVSWQIVPTAMDEMLQTKDEKKLARVTEAFLEMKKFDIKKLKEAGDSK